METNKPTLQEYQGGSIAGKATKGQAGALAGEKWLVVYLDPVYAIAVALTIEAFLKQPESWQAFESKIDRCHFEEVWLVWDKRQQRNVADSEQGLNVVRFTTRGLHFVDGLPRPVDPRAGLELRAPTGPPADGS